jgi:hypothetical protein
LDACICTSFAIRGILDIYVQRIDVANCMKRIDPRTHTRTHIHIYIHSATEALQKETHAAQRDINFLFGENLCTSSCADVEAETHRGTQMSIHYPRVVDTTGVCTRDTMCMCLCICDVSVLRLRHTHTHTRTFSHILSLYTQCTCTGPFVTSSHIFTHAH